MVLLRTLGSIALLSLPLAAQSSFNELYREITAERRELVQSKPERPSPQEFQALNEAHAKRIEAWLAAGARGSDAANGRFLLVDILRNLGQDERAKSTLLAIDVENTPPFDLLVAARLAQGLGLLQQREAWIDVASARPGPIEERARVATFLMTVLEEVDRAEAIFLEEMKRARDDEARARVQYFRCSAIRDREDLPEGSYEVELERLAEAFPNTYWGGIAKDRGRALALSPGDAAIPFEGTTLAGNPISLASLAGRTVLLEFWSDYGDGDKTVVDRLQRIRKQFEGAGLAVVGIQMTEDADEARDAVRRSGRTWPQLWDGRGWETDAALRYAIEQVPFYVLIDRDGNVVSTRIFLQDEAGAADLERRLEALLRDQ